MLKKALLLILLVLFALPGFTKSQKRKRVSHYHLSEDNFITLHPVVSNRKNKFVNVYNIHFLGLSDDVIATKLVDPAVTENDNIKFKKPFSKVQENSSIHKFKMSKEIEDSVAFYMLETYTQGDGELELSESIPVRFNIGLVSNRGGCISVVSCGEYVFPDLEFKAWVGYVCSPGGAVKNIISDEECR